MVNPVVVGDYPAVVKKNAGPRLVPFTNYESKLVKSSFDFLGINHYSVIHAKDNPDFLKSENRDMMQDMGVVLDKLNLSSHEFPIRPRGLQMTLEYFKQVCGNPPIYLYSRKWNGSNVRGYFTWSFLDVFELMDGYKTSFGLYYVDMDDPELKRYRKLSANWYAQFLKGGNVSSESDEAIRLHKNSTTNLLSVN